MPNSDPVNDCVTVTSYIVDRARRFARVNVLPIGAITKQGHNKELCRRYINIMREYVKRHLGFEGFEGYGCGLCQTGVPCESGIPK